jgi:hypothetical protein
MAGPCAELEIRFLPPSDKGWIAPATAVTYRAYLELSQCISSHRHAPLRGTTQKSRQMSGVVVLQHGGGGALG